MNKVTSIGWSQASWNPVTGCQNPCQFDYCYNTQKATAPLNRFGSCYYSAHKKAFVTTKNWLGRQTKNRRLYVAKQGERYPRGFDPTWYESRLWYPKKVKVPQRVFVVDTGDLFGKWIPAEWIEKVIEVMTACDWHKYFLLTKNPKRYQEFTFPDHCWLGATVTGQKDAGKIRIMQGLNHPHKFLSVEPLFTPLAAPLDNLQWIVIGAQTGPNPRVPKAAWVDTIVQEARRVKAQIYLKENLLPYYQGRTIYQQKP